MESDKRISINTVIKYFAYAAIAVEAVFAAFWLFKNIGVLQSDYVAHTYILAADSFVVDDSMGILYALIVRVLGHGAVLQIVQVVIGTLAVLFFATSLLEKSAAVVLTGFVALNPIVLQAETAVAPGALVLACVLIAIGSVVRSKGNTKWYAGLFVSALLAGFLNPDYAYLFAVGGFVCFICKCVVRKRFEVVLLVLVAISVIMPVFVNRAIGDDRAYGRVHRSAEYLVMQRLAWSRMTEYGELAQAWLEYYAGGPDAEYNLWLADADKVPEDLSLEFANRFEEAVGVENARDYYKTVSQYAWGKGLGYWAHDWVRDELLYLAAPASAAYAYLAKITDTSVVNGLNFMFRESPTIFKIYFLFASAALVVLIVLYICKCFIKPDGGRRVIGLPVAVSILAIIVLLSLYASLICVREFDYRNVLFMVVGWPAAVMALTERRDTV